MIQNPQNLDPVLFREVEEGWGSEAEVWWWCGTPLWMLSPPSSSDLSGGTAFQGSSVHLPSNWYLVFQDIPLKGISVLMSHLIHPCLFHTAKHIFISFFLAVITLPKASLVHRASVNDHFFLPSLLCLPKEQMPKVSRMAPNWKLLCPALSLSMTPTDPWLPLSMLCLANRK